MISLNIDNFFKTKFVVVILKKNLNIITLKNRFIVKIKKLNKIFIKQFLIQIKSLAKITTTRKKIITSLFESNLKQLFIIIFCKKKAKNFTKV